MQRRTSAAGLFNFLSLAHEKQQRDAQSHPRTRKLLVTILGFMYTTLEGCIFVLRSAEKFMSTCTWCVALYTCVHCTNMHLKLVMHEEKCHGRGAKERPTTWGFELDDNSSNALQDVILVARSSGEPPDSWLAGTDSLETGLPIFGRAILKHYRAAHPSSRGKAVFHICYQVATRHLLAPLHCDASKEKTQANQAYIRRAHMLTQAIEKDLNIASAAGLIPTILSIGIDAWACEVKMILPWINRVPHFVLAIRETQLVYGMTVANFTEHGKVFWAHVESEEIRNSIEHGSNADSAAGELITAWNAVQSLKDARTADKHLRNGRNKVDLTAVF